MHLKHIIINVLRCCVTFLTWMLKRCALGQYSGMLTQCTLNWCTMKTRVNWDHACVTSDSFEIGFFPLYFFPPVCVNQNVNAANVSIISKQKMSISKTHNLPADSLQAPHRALQVILILYLCFISHRYLACFGYLQSITSEYFNIMLNCPAALSLSASIKNERVI